MSHRDQQLMEMEESSRLCNCPGQPPRKQSTSPLPPCCVWCVLDPRSKRLYPLGFSTEGPQSRWTREGQKGASFISTWGRNDL